MAPPTKCTALPTLATFLPVTTSSTPAMIRVCIHYSVLSFTLWHIALHFTVLISEGHSRVWQGRADRHYTEMGSQKFYIFAWLLLSEYVQSSIWCRWYDANFHSRIILLVFKKINLHSRQSFCMFLHHLWNVGHFKKISLAKFLTI